MSIGFYTDSGLTTQADLNFVQAIDDSIPLQKKRLFFGDPDSSKSYMAFSNPGTDQIEVSCTDPNMSDTFTPSFVKIAGSSVDLDTATPGASFAIGTQVDGGAGNAVEVWFEVIDADQAQGAYPLNIVVNSLVMFGA